MIITVVDARYAGDYRIWLRFSDGVSGEIDLEGELWGPIFAPLKNKEEFAKLIADRELDTVVWPNGADFAPDFLYERIKSTNKDRYAAE